jgi:hypothetical protein
MPDGPDTGRWKRVTLEVSTFPVAKSENIGHVMVDYARLAVACADGLGGWSHEEPLDGRADFVFWGLDAAKVAHTIGAPRLEDDQFGWENLDVYEAAARGQDVEKVRAQDDLKFATDFRPHSHNYELLRQVRVSTTESGVVAIGAAKLCGFATTWGDGIFPVYRDLAKDGSLVQVRIEVGNDQIVARQRAMDERYFGAFAKYALVSKRALEENRFIGWLYREKPHREDDSGWRLFVGDEKQEYLDVPDNIAIVPLRDLIDREKALEEVLRCLEGSAFERKAADAPFVRVPPKG